MSAPILLPVDSRGRITIGKQISKRGIEPAPFYALSFEADGSLRLVPATVTTGATK